MADTECCPCGQPAEDRHHLTGRGPDGDYLDPDLAVPVCHDDHELAGEDLRAEGLERPLRAPSGPVTAVEQVAYRLDRVGVFLGRVAEVVPALVWVTVLAGHLRRWAEQLWGTARRLDAWDPGWRLAGGAS